MSEGERTPEETIIHGPQEFLDLLTSITQQKIDTDELADTLNVEIDDALPWLRYPLDFSQPQQEARQKIQTDKSYPAYRIEEIIFLSDYLHISETLAASILSVASQESARHGRTATETAIKTFHDLIAIRLECIKAVLAASNSLILPDTMEITRSILEQTFSRIYDKSRFTTLSGVSVDGFGDSILKQLATCNTWISETIPGDKRIPQAVRLQEDVQVLRVQSSRSHQRALAKCLYEVGASGEISKGDLIALVKWLRAREELDGTTIMMISCFLAAIQHNPENKTVSEAWPDYPEPVRALVEDPACLQIVTTLINVHQEWKQEWIARVLMLGWGILVDKAQKYTRTEKHSFGKHMEKGPEGLIQGAIENDAFQYLRCLFIPSLEVTGSLWPKTKKDHRERGVAANMQDQWPEVENEYQRDTLRQVDSLVKDLIGSYQIIKRLKLREEDKVKALEMAQQDGKGVEYEEETRQDFLAFVELVISVYQELPLDHDDRLWIDSKFINLVEDLEGLQARALLCRLLLAISSGPGGSYWLYCHLNKDTSSINLDDIHTHFEWVSSQKVSTSRLASAHAALNKGMEVSSLSDPDVAPEDAECLVSYCDMISLIIKWNPKLAGEIDQAHKTVKKLWELVNRNLPSNLSAAILNTLSALTSPSSIAASPSLSESSISSLEALNVLSRRDRPAATRPTTGFAMATEEANAAWLTSLEDHDVALQSSLNRVALVGLFKGLTAISDPASGSFAKADAARLANLKRIRGKMADYVLNEAFKSCIEIIQQGNAAAGYPLLEAILKYITSVLVDLDLQSLVDPKHHSTSAPTSDTNRLQDMQDQPGFIALRRVLSDETLREAIFVAARLRVAEGLPDAVPVSLFGKISFRAIVILRAVMACQGLFLEVIVPNLRRTIADNAAHNQQLAWTSGNLLPIDWHLAHQPQTITQIASYVAGDVTDGLASVTIAFLSDLSQSSHMRVPFLMGGRTVQGNIMTYVFRDAANSSIVLAGFVDRLERGENEATVKAEIIPSRLIPAYDEEIEAQVPKRAQQNQIMDLLLQNTSSDRSDITFAHFLLGYLDPSAHVHGIVKHLLRDGPQAGTILENGKVVEVMRTIPRTCFHVLVERLSSSLTTLGQQEEEELVPSVIEDSPEFGYKCIKLLRQLVQNDSTAQVTARYLRGQEDLIRRSLLFLPLLPVSVGTGEQGRCVYEDGSSIDCEADELVYLLQYQAEVCSLAALDLHLLDSSADEVLHIHEALLQDTSVYSQSIRGILALALLACFNFTWETNSDQPNASGFETIQFESCKTTDSTGTIVYSVNELDRLMEREVERVQRKLSLTQKPENLDNARMEIIAYLKRENGKARVVNAAMLGLEAWSTILTASLTKGVDAADQITKNLIFDLSDACYQSLLSSTMQINNKAEIINSVLLTLSGTLLRMERTETDVRRGGPPIDRLQNLLSLVCQAIGDGEMSEVARGLLYSTLADYLKLLRLFVDNSGVTEGEGITWLAAVLQPVYTDLERILTIVGRDALNGSSDWQMVSYTLLDELLAAFGKRSDVFIQILGRKGFLHNFLTSIRVADSAIQATFSPDAVDVNPVLVLETQLALLSRLATTSNGAQALIESGLFESFSACRFVGARPTEMANVEEEAFIIISERYHRALVPVLRLLVDVVASAGDRGYKSAAKFVDSQREVLLPFFGFDERISSASALEALELVVRLLFTIADDERKMVKKSQTVLNHYNSALRRTAVRFIGVSNLASMIQPVTAEEVVLSETPHLLDDCSIFDAKVRKSITALQRSILGYCVDTTAASDDFKPIIIAGGQLGYDRQATRGGSTFLTFSNLVAALNENILRFSSMTSLFEVVTRLVEEDAGVLADKELEQLAALEADDATESSSPSYRKLLAQKQLQSRRVSSAAEARTCLQSIEAILIVIYRHIRFYNNLVTEQTAPNRRFQAPSAQKPVEQDIVLGWHTDVTDTLNDIGPILRKLHEVSLVEGIVPVQASREAYLKVLVEAVQDLRPAGNTA